MILERTINSTIIISASQRRTYRRCGSRPRSLRRSRALERLVRQRSREACHDRGPVRIRGDIFATARRWRGRLLPTGHPASRLARRRRRGGGARREGCGGGVGVPRARPVAAGVRVDVIAPRAGGGGLCSWAASSSSVSTSRSFTPCSVFRAGGRRSVGWADVLLDAIGVGWKAPSAL